MLLSASSLQKADVVEEEIGKTDEDPVRKLFVSKYKVKDEERTRVLAECDSKTFQLFDSGLHEEAKEFFALSNDVVPCFWSPKVKGPHLAAVFTHKVLTKLVELMRLHGNSWSVAHMCVGLPLPEDTMMILLASDSFKDHFTSTRHPKDYTLLHLAIELKSLAACKAIMRCSDLWLGGENPGFFIEDLDGMIPLQKANEENAKECLDYLMGSQSHGGLVGQKTSGIWGFFGTGIVESFQAALESKSYEKIRGMLKENPQLVKEAFADGSTALHKVKDPKTTKVLLEFSADISTSNNQGDLPLHAIIRTEYNKENKLAAKDRQNCVLVLLAYANCDPNCRNLKDGTTPLHVAAQVCDFLCLKTLIVYNADLSLVNHHHQTPLDVAKLRDWQQGIDLLWMLKAPSCSVMDSYPGQSNILSLQSMFCRQQSDLESSDEEEDYVDTYSSLTSIENALTFLPPDETQLTNELDSLLQQASLSRRPKVGDRVLSLDGGGIKGLVLIEMLCAMEERTGRRIVDLFDWIVGTSTGGILALALVYTDKSLHELRNMYFKLKDNIFAKCFSGAIPYSNTEALEEILKETFGEDQKLGSKDHPRVLITATDISHDPSRLVFFNNFEDGELGKDQLIWVAARCTSAAPVHFEQYDKFVDGGVKANNPSPDALTRIHDYYKKTHKKKKCKVCCFVSLGCGRFDKERNNTHCLNFRQHLENFTWWHPIKGFIKLKQSFSGLLGVLVTEMVESDYQPVTNARAHCEQMDAKFYRLSPHMEEMVELDEQNCERLVDLLIKTKLYMLQSSSTLDDIKRYTVL